MKRYWLFVYDEQPLGGMHDLRGTYDTVDEALEVYMGEALTMYHIWDSEAKQILTEGLPESKKIELKEYYPEGVINLTIELYDGKAKERLAASNDVIPSNFEALLDEYNRLPEECPGGYDSAKFCGAGRRCQWCFTKPDRPEFDS